MTPTRREQSEADWDAWKSTIRRLYLHEKRPLKLVLEYLWENGFNASKAQLWRRLEQWRFRQNMNREAWNFVRHRISRRERAGKKSDVILSGVRLRPEAIHKETLRNRPLPKLGRAHISPSPEPPSNLPLIICSPVPMEITFNWPQTLPWIQFRAMIQEQEWKRTASNISYSGSLVSPLVSYRQPSIVGRLISDIIWNQQCPSKISARIGLIIPELWEGENLARADILVSDSGSEKLRHILDIFIATVSNDTARWEDIEVNWNILQYVLAWSLSSVLNYELLESQTMKAFSDNLFRLAFDDAIYSLSNGAERPNAQICYQVITWLFRAGYNPNRPRRKHHLPEPLPGINHTVSALQHAVTFGDRFQTMVHLLLEFGADINAGNDNGEFSALQLVLDEHAMRSWTGSSPRVEYLQEAFIDKAVKGHNTKQLQILAEHALRHGKKDLLQNLCKQGFNLDFRQHADFGLSSEVTAITCAAQFCPSSEEDSWHGWLNFVLSLMPPGERYFSDWPAHLFVDPLVCAAGAGNNAAIRYFLGLGGGLDAHNEHGIFPLIAAVAHRRTNTCKLLLSLGADGNKTGLNGLSAIHVAAMIGDYEIIQVLTNVTEDKKGAIRFNRELQDILLRLRVICRAEADYNIPAPTALDIVVLHWEYEQGRPGEYEESFKHLLRNGFYLSPSTVPYWPFKQYHMFSKDNDLPEILADTHLDMHSFRDDWQHNSLKEDIGRCAIYSRCTRVIKKYFENCRELQRDVLSLALSKGDIETAKFVLGLGVDIKTKGREDPSFLESAILSKDQNTIDWALSAEPGYYDPGALCAAAQLAVATEPILCYEKVLARRPESLIADPLESTAVGIAASGNNTQLLRDLLSALPPSPNCLIDEGRSYEDLFPDIKEFWRRRFPASEHPRCRNGSPLTYAVGRGREKNFSLLLRHGYRPDALTLFRAIAVGSLEQIKCIYDSGLGDLIAKSPSYLSMPKPKPIFPFTMSTLLQIAAYKNRTDVAQWLLEREPEFDGWREDEIFSNSPLQYAVEYGNLELVNILLKHGASPNEKPAKEEGMTALQLAAGNGFIGIAKILIDHETPADVNAHRSPFGGLTALESASQNGRLDMVQFLLSSGAKTEGTGQRQYIRAILLAQNSGHVEVVNLLKAHRQWTPRDEELFRNEDVEEYHVNVHESECSNSECEFFHEYRSDGDDGEDGELRGDGCESDDSLSISADMEEPGRIVCELEHSGSERELPHTLADSGDSEESDIEGDEYGNDDGAPTSVDNDFAKDDIANTFLEDTSAPWAEVMTLEEAEAAFISYED
ncbi:ankyrin repeat-containing domain protein [Xylaria grammica]|nr:ankyrin repeat-containing domain protein [Xylaria grammica]